MRAKRASLGMGCAQDQEELAPEAGGQPQPARSVVAQWEEANACAKLAGALRGKPVSLAMQSEALSDWLRNPWPVLGSGWSMHVLLLMHGNVAFAYFLSLACGLRRVYG